MDERKSVASMYLTQTYFHSLKREFSDRVVASVLQHLIAMSDSGELDARDLAENIHLMTRTVAG